VAERLGALATLDQALGGLAATATHAAGATAGLSMALTNPIASLTTLTTTTQKFVEALSPGTIAIFQQALDNLNATIGVAFEPLFQVLSDTLPLLTSALAPLMEQLRPIVEQLTVALSERLLTTVMALVGIFEALMPLIQFVMDLFTGLTPLLQGLTAVVGALIEAFVSFLSSLLGGETGMRDFAQQFADLMRRLTVTLLTFVIQLADAFGAPRIGEAILRNLGRPTAGGGQVAAVRNVQIQGFEAITRDLATAAAAASGGAAARREVGLGDIVAELQANRGQQSTLVQNIVEVKRFVEGLYNHFVRIGEAAREAAEAFVGPWSPQQREAFLRAREQFGGWLGGFQE
jgi:hypothetical protein